eukprot:1159542-Pelagomonas_calceolata.AAC.14
MAKTCVFQKNIAPTHPGGPCSDAGRCWYSGGSRENEPRSEKLELTCLGRLPGVGGVRMGLRTRGLRGGGEVRSRSCSSLRARSVSSEAERRGTVLLRRVWDWREAALSRKDPRERAPSQEWASRVRGRWGLPGGEVPVCMRSNNKQRAKALTHTESMPCSCCTAVSESAHGQVSSNSRCPD